MPSRLTVSTPNGATPLKEIDVPLPPDPSPDHLPEDDQGWRPHLSKAVQDSSGAPDHNSWAPEQVAGYGYEPASGYEAVPGYATQGGYGPQPGYPPQPGDAPQPGYAPQGGYPSHPGYPGYPGYGPPAKTNTLAVTSMVTGIVGWTVIPFLASIAAIVLGHIARAQIRRTREQGTGMAVAGLVLGYSAVVLQSVAVVCFVILVGYMYS